MAFFEGDEAGDDLGVAGIIECCYILEGICELGCPESRRVM